MGARGDDSASYFLDEGDACLRLGRQRIHLAPKAFEVLAFLASRPGRLVTRDEILDAVWTDTHVTESVLSVAVAQIRDALADDARQPRFIETVHRRGYRWVGQLGYDTAPRAETTSSLVADAIPIGREQQVSTLVANLERAAAGTSRLCFVTGESGIGKSAVLDALAGAAGRSDWQVARGGGVESYGMGEPYMPVLEAMESLSRSADSPEAIEVLRREAPTWLVQMPGLLDREDALRLEKSLAASTRERMIREVLRAMQVMASRRPLLLLLEDLQWSDPATVALLAAFAARRDRARVAVVVTLRPVDAIARLNPVVPMMREAVARGQAEEIRVDGLDLAQVRAFLRQRLSVVDPPGELVDILHTQTGGNPLFLGHAIEDWLQRGWILRDGPTWRVAISHSELTRSVPGSTRAMIELRMDGLGARPRRTLEAASLAGNSFSTPAVAAATGRSIEEVEEDCALLARDSAFLRQAEPARWPDGTTAGQYVFGHALYAQVLAASVPPSIAAAMHERIADRLASGYSARPGEIAGQLAMHYEAAGDNARALPFRLEASRVAHRRNSPLEALAHLRTALSALPGRSAGRDRDEAELAIRAAMLPPLFATAGAAQDEFAEVASRVAELSSGQPLGLPSLAANWALMGSLTTRGDFAAGLAVCERVLSNCDDSTTGSIVRIVALGQRGFCRLLLGDTAGAIEDLRPSLDLPSLIDIAPVEPSTMARGNLALASALGDDSQAAAAMARKTWQDAESAGHAPTLSWATATAVRVGILGGDVALAKEASTRGWEVAEQFAVNRWRHLAAVGRAWCTGAEGDRSGIDDLASARRSLVDSGFVAFDSLHALAEAGLRAGLGDEKGAAHVAARSFASRGKGSETAFDSRLDVFREPKPSPRARSPKRRS